MPRKTIPLGNFGKGITPAVSDKKSIGWKVFDNVNQSDVQGGITARNGVTASRIFTGGSTAGTSIITTQLMPAASDDPAWNISDPNAPMFLNVYGGWMLNAPEIYFTVEVKNPKYVRSLILKGLRGVGSWNTSNSNAQMKLTLMEYTTEYVMQGTFGQPGYMKIGNKYNFKAPLGTSTVFIGNITSEVEKEFVFVNDNSIRLEAGKTYIVKIELLNLSNSLTSGNSLQIRNVSMTYDMEVGNPIRLTGGVSYDATAYTAQYNRFYHRNIAFSIKGANVTSGYIDNTIHTALSSSAFIAITKGDIRASTDKTTDRSIMPAIVDTSMIPYKYTPTYNMGDERYGVSMVADGETHYLALLSTLLHPTIGDGEIIQFNSAKQYGTRIKLISAKSTDIIVTGFSDPALGTGNRPAAAFQYGVKYKYDNVLSELTTGEISTTGSRPGAEIDFVNATDGKSPNLQIPFSPDLTQIPTGFTVYRRAVVLKGVGTDERITGNDWQVVIDGDYTIIGAGTPSETYFFAPGVTIDRANNKVTFTDQSKYIVSGDFVVSEIAPDDFYEDPGITISPTPAFLFMYNGRMIALGDKDNRSTWFFSKDGLSDFYADNSVTLDLPLADFCLSAGFAYGSNAYIASAHKIWRIIEVSDSLPYYRVEPVAGMDGLGIISPKTIIFAGGLVYFLTSEGLVAFNGSNYVNVSSDIGNYIKTLNMKYTNATGAEVNPWVENCFFAPYLAEAVYNEQDESIYLALPVGSNEINTMCFKYSLKTKSWSTVSVDGFRGLLTGNQQGVDLRSDSLFMSLTDGSKTNTAGDTSAPVVSTLESYDIVIPDQSQVNLMTLYGTGTVNVYVYMNRSITPKISKLNVVLKEYGVDIPINAQGFEFRYKIVSVTSEDFKLTSEPKVTVTSSGQRIRPSVA